MGQSVKTRLLSDDGRTARIEFEISWSKTLAEFVDSSGVNEWNATLLKRLTDGIDEHSYQFEIGPKSAMLFSDTNRDRGVSVSVVEQSYEEYPVTLGASAVRKSPDRVVMAVGAGTHRKMEMVSISANFFTLNVDNTSVRRYNRIVVDVSRNGGGNQPAVFADGIVYENPHLVVDRSLLADGTNYRISITSEGIYSIDRSLLTAIGLNPDEIDPDQIRILGNGGKPVPALNSAFRYADLKENGVFRRGGGDGRFDPGDVILFYASGPSGWEYNADTWKHYIHPYSSENVYFLNVAATNGQDIEEIPFPGFFNPTVHVSSEGRYVADFEEFLWSREHGSGSDWMSFTIRSGGSKPLLKDVNLPGFEGGTIRYRTRVAIASNPKATVAMSSGGAVLAQFTATTITVPRSDSPSAVPGTFTFEQVLNAGEPVNLDMRLLPQSNEPEAATDWVRISYDQQLVSDGGFLRFASRPKTSGEQAYRLRGFSTTPLVWDITDAAAFRQLQTGGSGGFVEIQFSIGVADKPREFVAFSESAAEPLSADALSLIPNQNLHGIPFFPEFVIVTPSEFMGAANRLADKRRAEGMNVQVVDIKLVFNEFSGGLADMRAIRDYFKFLYDRAPDEASLLKYVLFLGDGHYDFRGLANKQQDTNWIFPFETAESLNTDASFTSDDYFGLLDDDEGVWPYGSFSAVSNERLDIGVGRLPATSAAQADMLVEKIFHYEDPETLGAWRSTYLAIADDGPTGLAGIQNDADLHVQNIDQVAEYIRLGLYPEVNVRKIYAESYERVFQNGFKIPEAKKEINAAVEAGVLVFNYSGHGGPSGLAQEEIFTREDAEALTNYDRLAVFITATCSFGWWDLDDDYSGAEALLYNPEGGAVALLTTNRLVYTSGDTTSLNAGLNRAINKELFTLDANGLGPRLGDVFRLTKNTRVGLQGNSRKFNLLGDPTMRIGIPDKKVFVESLNGDPLETETGQLKALDKVEIEGSILGKDGTVDFAFNGQATVTVYDAVRKVPLVEQRRMRTPYYRIREDLIWRGDVAVTNGEFKAVFVVPKDISYSNEIGRIAVYAKSPEGAAIGYNENFKVGGTSDFPPDDNVGPEIRLFLNDTTFVSGGLISSNPQLIARFYDESGINTVGAGVGHEMLLVVDSDDQGAQDISSAFVSAPNSYQRGEARWELSVENEGMHSLSVRSWDVLNNSATAELSFLIANDEVLELRNVYNYPNPMNQETQFVFEHNQPVGTPASVRIRIYSLSGRPIHTIDSDIALPEGILTGNSVQIHWDGRDDDFDRVATGIYLYKLSVEVEKPDGSREVSERIEKLAVIR